MRIRFGIALALVFVLALGVSSAGANAWWNVTKNVSSGAVATGDLRVTSTWASGSGSTWGNLAPGGTSGDRTLQVVVSGAGSTLHWKIRVIGTVNPSFNAYMTFHAWEGACGTGTPIPNANTPAPGDMYPVSGNGHKGNRTMNICVRFTLLSSAPPSLAGLAVQPNVTVAVEQQR
ncbi:hypothetical protein [Humidisolicoccus flavus]|uniref:hypothetical protein n=1 Tax=Humidisolicoccus flavus TaxID=3111414 RepID=UPI003245B4FC